MDRFIARVVAVASPLALSSTLMASPAQAATKTFYDGNQTGPDITRVKVTNGTKYVTVSVNVGSMIPEDLFTLWIDTVSSNAGPEYKATIRPNTEWERLRRVGSFSSTGTKVDGVLG